MFLPPSSPAAGSHAAAGTAPATDVLVVGAGPAGLALAAELARQGLGVRVVDPAPQAPFPATYGAWHDDLPDWAAAHAARTWADVRVYTGPAPTALERPYTLLDNAALRAELLRRAGPHLTLTQGTVDGLAGGGAPGVVGGPGGWAVTGHTPEGPAHWEARVVVDASGHRPVLAAADAGRHPGGVAWQTASGLVATFDRPPSAPGAAVWMDYRSPHGPRGEATFLYAMHLGGDRYFVEETSLIARPAPTRAALSERLHARLRAQGTPPREVLSDEWVAFPMNTAAPEPGTAVLAFGAAAGLVHPISGFQVAGALRDAPVLAAALAGALRGGQDPVAAGWAALWPPERRAARAVHLLGVQALLNLPPAALPAFFAAFFALPPARWRAFLHPHTPAGPLARTMLRLFGQAPAGVRLPLARAALQHAATSLHALQAAARS